MPFRLLVPFAGPAAARPHASSPRRTIAGVGSGRRGVPRSASPPNVTTIDYGVNVRVMR